MNGDTTYSRQQIPWARVTNTAQRRGPPTSRGQSQRFTPSPLWCPWPPRPFSFPGTFPGQVNETGLSDREGTRSRCVDKFCPFENSPGEGLMQQPRGDSGPRGFSSGEGGTFSNETSAFPWCLPRRPCPARPQGALFTRTAAWSFGMCSLPSRTQRPGPG